MTIHRHTTYFSMNWGLWAHAGGDAGVPGGWKLECCGVWNRVPQYPGGDAGVPGGGRMAVNTKKGDAGQWRPLVEKVCSRSAWADAGDVRVSLWINPEELLVFAGGDGGRRSQAGVSPWTIDGGS